MEDIISRMCQLKLNSVYNIGDSAFKNQISCLTKQDFNVMCIEEIPYDGHVTWTYESRWFPVTDNEFQVKYCFLSDETHPGKQEVFLADISIVHKKNGISMEGEMNSIWAFDQIKVDGDIPLNWFLIAACFIYNIVDPDCFYGKRIGNSSFDAITMLINHQIHGL